MKCHVFKKKMSNLKVPNNTSSAPGRFRICNRQSSRSERWTPGAVLLCTVLWCACGSNVCLSAKTVRLLPRKAPDLHRCPIFLDPLCAHAIRHKNVKLLSIVITSKNISRLRGHNSKPVLGLGETRGNGVPKLICIAFPYFFFEQ